MMTRFIFPIIFSLLFIVHLDAQDRLGPCLRVYVDPGCPANPEDAVSLNFLSVGLSHPDITVGLTNQDSARYKAFWIFGDGNFAHFDDREKDDDIATLSTVYTYASNSEYNPRSILVEKKSDREPPARTKRKVRISQVGTGETVNKPSALATFEQNVIQRALLQLITASNFQPRVTNNYRVDNLNSSKIRLGGYETAFAISSLIPQSDSSVIVLCYNSVIDKIPGEYRAINLFTGSEVEIANYTNTVGRIAPINALPPELSVFLQRYRDVIAQPIEIGNNKPTNFSEFRFFPVLNTPLKDSITNKYPETGLPILDRTGKGIAQFLVLVLENARYIDTTNASGQFSQLLEPVSENAQGSSITRAQRDTILSLVNRYMNGYNFENDSTLQLSNRMYLRGVHYLTVPVVTVIDPTELKVLKICKEEGDTYKADMKLTVCNEGNAMETLVKVNLLTTEGIPYQELTFNTPAPSGFVDTNLNDFAFDIANLRGAYNEQLEYQESCVDVSFSFKTNWQGVELLRDGKGLIARVNFTSAAVDTVQNFPNKVLESKKVSKEYGYQCGDPEPKFDCMLLCILLFVLLLLLWWYWKNKQEE